MKQELTVNGQSAFLIRPNTRIESTGGPWVWYAPTLPGLPGEEENWMFDRFRNHGLAIAGVDVGESYGNPKGREAYTAFHRTMVSQYGLAEKACLLARSRGGLMLYNWAAEHRDSVACIAGIYPVCNLRSYPGLDQASSVYGLTSGELETQLSKHNPIDRLTPLAQAGVFLFHLHGDSDTVVPLEPNSGELSRRYRELGGTITLQVARGGGHDRDPSWFQCEDLVTFVIAHAPTGRPD